MSCVSIHEMLKMCASTFVKIVLLRHSICKRRWNERGNGLHNNNRTRKEEEKNLHGSKIPVLCLFIVWHHLDARIFNLPPTPAERKKLRRQAKEEKEVRSTERARRRNKKIYAMIFVLSLEFSFFRISSPGCGGVFQEKERIIQSQTYLTYSIYACSNQTIAIGRAKEAQRWGTGWVKCEWNEGRYHLLFSFLFPFIHSVILLVGWFVGICYCHHNHYSTTAEAVAVATTTIHQNYS